MVVAPTSTMGMSIASGAGIPIEQRAAEDCRLSAANRSPPLEPKRGTSRSTRPRRD